MSSTDCVIVVILVDFIRLQNLEEIGRACRILSVKLTWRGIENGVEDLLAAIYHRNRNFIHLGVMDVSSARK